jgi:hypothetical protein
MTTKTTLLKHIVTSYYLVNELQGFYLERGVAHDLNFTYTN